VPTIVSQYLIQSVPVIHSLIVLDIADRTKPVEKPRLALNDSQRPHWMGWDIRTQRLVVTGSESRLYLLKLDETAGTLSMDDGFQDTDRKPGFNFADRDWLYGSKGFGLAHGVVFSR
jgi:hypothetical protein